MKSIIMSLILCFMFSIQSAAKDRVLPQIPHVIPVMLDENVLESLNINPGDNLWFEMVYSV